MCAAQLLQLCPALCDLMDGSLPGTSVPGILQARILEWVAITSSWESSQPKNQTPCLLHLLHWQVGSLPQSPPGKPEIMHRQCQVHSFLFVCLFFKSLSRVQLFVTPWIVWNSPGQNTGVASLSLLQGIFQTQGSNPGLPHCRQILYQLSHKGSLRIVEWAAYPFSRGSSQPRNQTGVSCITGRFFTYCAIREVHS